MKPDIRIIAHDIRSTHNIGSLIRTADALGIGKIYFTGYTPYPAHSNDSRIPHEAAKIDRQINKTALGAQHSVALECHADITELIAELKMKGYEICALEQSKNSQSLISYKPAPKLAVLLGREVEGIEPGLLKIADRILEIPMLGKKESLNVVQAAAITLYHLRFYDDIIN